MSQVVQKATWSFTRNGCLNFSSPFPCQTANYGALTGSGLASYSRLARRVQQKNWEKPVCIGVDLISHDSMRKSQNKTCPEQELIPPSYKKFLKIQTLK